MLWGKKNIGERKTKQKQSGFWMINGGKGLPQQFQLKINTQFHLDLETMPHYPLAVKMLKINLLMAILKRQNTIF